LVELLVVIAIIGTLMGLLLPAVQNAREAGRANQCRANLTQLQMAMAGYEAAMKEYPGYVNDMGAVKASWAAMLLPHLEQQSLWDKFSAGKQAPGPINFFECPSNPPNTEGAPAMSYLANAGYIGNERINEKDDCAPTENIANGMFFDRVRAGTPDIRDLDPKCQSTAHDPVYRVAAATIQSQGDGSTNTLMLSEGLSALYWAHVGGDAPDKKWHFGFCWEQPAAISYAEQHSPSRPDVARDPQFRRINGVREPVAGQALRDKTENSAFPSSYHPGGVNVAFAGGQVRLLSERINTLVYAQLMTSNHKRSDLRAGEVKDRDLPAPGGDDY
jgi:prepilin-type processing-associated H-X9-DG protein